MVRLKNTNVKLKIVDRYIKFPFAIGFHNCDDILDIFLLRMTKDVCTVDVLSAI